MGITTECPRCGILYKNLPDTYLDKAVRCKKCKKTFVINALQNKESATISAVCPGCNARFKNVSSRYIGKSTKCKRCGTRFAIQAAPSSTSSGSSSQVADSISVAGNSVPRSKGDVNAPVKSEVKTPVSWGVGDIILDLYEITELLGEGGMGKVFKVHHRGWKMDLAVKSPRPQIMQSKGAPENFEREAETWVNLGLHPHTVSCYYVRRIGGIPRIFAEYIDGGSLADWIRDCRLYKGGHDRALERILDIAIQFAWGLDYSHDKGLVHQDVKPGNVMLTMEGIAKVTDFGLARARPMMSDMERTGGTMIVGKTGMTPAYASPEQINGKALSRRTDLWSWALSILEMFTGEVTWSTGSVAREVLAMYLKDDHGTNGIPRMPDTLADLLERCFRENPEDRPHNMGEIANGVIDMYYGLTGKKYSRTRPKAGSGTADSLSNRGVSLLDLNRKKEAEFLFHKALKIEPHHPEATYNLGLLEWRSGRKSDLGLVRELDEVRKSHEADWVDEYLLGMVQMERGDFEKAIEIFEDIEGEDAQRKEVKACLETAKMRLQKPKEFKLSDSSLNSLCLSRDGSFLFVGGDDCTLRKVDTTTGNTVQSFAGHNNRIISVILSPDEQYLLSADWSGGVFLRDIGTGQVTKKFSGHNGEIFSMALSRDGKKLIAGTKNFSMVNAITLWDVPTEKMIRIFEEIPERITSVAFIGNGQYILTGSWDGALRIWETDSGRLVRTLKGQSRAIECAGLSRDGSLAISGDTEGNIHLWDIKNSCVKKTLQGHSASVYAISFSKCERFIISGSGDKTVRLWEKSTGRCLRTFIGNAGEAKSLCLGENHAFCATGDGTVRCWPIDMENSLKAPMAVSRVVLSEALLSTQEQYETFLTKAHEAMSNSDFTKSSEYIRQARSCPGYSRRKEALDVWRKLYRRLPKKKLVAAWETTAFDGHEGPVSSVSISSDGRFAVSGGYDSLIHVWDVQTAKILRSFEGHPDTGVLSVALAHDGLTALSGAENSIKLWDVTKGRLINTFEGSSGEVKSVSLSSDGQFALSVTSDGNIVLWEVATGRSLRMSNTKATCVAFAEDSSLALFGDMENRMNLLNVPAGRVIRVYEGHEHWLLNVSFDHNSGLALSGSYDKTLRLWDVGTGRLLQSLEGHMEEVTSSQLSTDGRYAVSGSADKTVKIWGMENGKCLRTLEGHKDQVDSVCLSRDLSTVLSASKEGVIKIWTLDWELEDHGTTNWQEGVRPYLNTFLKNRCPYASELPGEGDPSYGEIVSSLTRRGKPVRLDEEMKGLLSTLGCAGYGSVRSELIKKELDVMADEWQEQPGSGDALDIKDVAAVIRKYADRMEAEVGPLLAALPRQPIDLSNMAGMNAEAWRKLAEWIVTGKDGDGNIVSPPKAGMLLFCNMMGVLRLCVNNINNCPQYIIQHTLEVKKAARWLMSDTVHQHTRDLLADEMEENIDKLESIFSRPEKPFPPGPIDTKRFFQQVVEGLRKGVLYIRTGKGDAGKAVFPEEVGQVLVDNMEAALVKNMARIYLHSFPTQYIDLTGALNQLNDIGLILRDTESIPETLAEMEPKQVNAMVSGDGPSIQLKDIPCPACGDKEQKGAECGACGLKYSEYQPFKVLYSAADKLEIAAAKLKPAPQSAIDPKGFMKIFTASCKSLSQWLEKGHDDQGNPLLLPTVGTKLLNDSLAVENFLRGTYGFCSVRFLNVLVEIRRLVNFLIPDPCDPSALQVLAAIIIENANNLEACFSKPEKPFPLSPGMDAGAFLGSVPLSLRNNVALIAQSSGQPDQEQAIKGTCMEMLNLCQGLQSQNFNIILMTSYQTRIGEISTATGMVKAVAIILAGHEPDQKYA